MTNRSTSTTTITRKRPRVQSQHSAYGTPRVDSSHDLNASVSSLDVASPTPLVNTDYFLSGGTDTPGAWSEYRLERAHELDAARDYRQSRFSQQPPGTPSHLTRSTAPKRLSEYPESTLHPCSQGWTLGGTAWALTGGLAGKIISFCWNTTFSGFSAGGGQAYTRVYEAVQNDNDDFITTRKSDNVPGSYPRNKKPIDLANCLTPEATTKLEFFDRQSEASANRNSWVFVEHNRPASRADDHSPIRKKSRASLAGATNTTTSARVDPFQPVQYPTTRTASFASPRSRVPSTAPVHVRPAASQKRPRSSFASPSRRQSNYFVHAPQSPVSPEVDAYQRKKRREEKKQDESLRRLNSQLQDMIKEGQQALGSKVEIVHDHDQDHLDEGYFDDDDNDVR